MSKIHEARMPSLSDEILAEAVEAEKSVPRPLKKKRSKKEVKSKEGGSGRASVTKKGK